jgi:hypothetical protein
MFLTRGRVRPTLLVLASASLLAGVATVPAALGTAAQGATRPAQNATSTSTQTSTQTSSQTSTQTSTRTVTGPRPFQPTGYWNTRLGSAPISTHSRAWIRDASSAAHTQNYLKLVLGDWGMPVFHSNASDPVFRITASGHHLRVHIPAKARPMPTSDAAIVVIDHAFDKVVSLQRATYAHGHWGAADMSRYGYQTNGIARGLPGGSRHNFGHRGIPGSVRAVTKAEIKRGTIRHRLEIYWWETASRTPEGASAYFPMTGSESGKTGVVPEGAVIRIKRNVDLGSLHLSPAAKVIARALKTYGAVIGDNSGTGNNLKLQAGVSWRGILNKDSLRHIPWKDFVFVKGGYRP